MLISGYISYHVLELLGLKARFSMKERKKTRTFGMADLNYANKAVIKLLSHTLIGINRYRRKSSVMAEFYIYAF
jgi:hypothetical protein